MKLRLSVVWVFLFLAGSLRAQPAGNNFGSVLSRSASERASPSEGERPIEFIPNLGQLSDKHGDPVPDVLYSSHYRGLTIYYASREMHFYFSRLIRKPDAPLTRPSPEHRGIAPPAIHDFSHDTLIAYRLDLKFIGANPSPNIFPADERQDYSNYYIPRFPNGLTDVPAYGSLLYENLYPNIDMRIYSTADGMKYDFLVHSGGDPKQIRMEYDGPDSLIMQHGEVNIFTPLGSLREESPVCYQREASMENESPATPTVSVASHYVVNGHEISFSIAHYDESKVLVIDPPRLWGTYFGGTNYDYFIGNCVDKSDNIFVSGTSLSLGFGTSGTYQDTLNHSNGYYWNAMVSKFNPSGSRVWSTYFGGGLDEGFGVAVDPGKNVVLIGETWSDTAVASTGAFQVKLNNQVADYAWDSFIARFDSVGHRYWSTYFGTPDTDLVYDVAVDSASNILIVGYTSSTSGIASTGAFKTSRLRTAMNDYGGFIAKFSPSGSRVWSTYIGDTVTECLGVCIGKGDSIIVSGLTVCKAGIATPGVYQPTMPNYVAGILMKFSPLGQRVWGTYVDGDVGPGFGTEMYRVACTPTGSIYTSGVTWAPTGLGTAGAYRTSITYGHDASVLEIFDGSGHRTAGTYFGESYREEIGFNVAVAPDGLPVMSGWTTDSTHIASIGAFQSAVNDTDVSFIAKFTKSGARKWGSYFSGNGHPGTWDPAYGLAVDHHGHPILSGGTGSDSGISTAGAYQTAFAGGTFDGYIEKFCDTLLTPLQFSADSVICFGQTNALSATSGYASYQWRRNGTAIAGATSSTYFVPVNQAPGSYRYTVDIADPQICNSITDTLHLTIRAAPTLNAGADKATCQKAGVQIGDTATGTIGPYHYAWIPGKGLSDSLIAKPIASPNATTTYIEIATDANGCQARDSVVVTVYASPQVTAPTNVAVCIGGSAKIGGNAVGGTAPYQYFWDPPTGLSATNIAQPIASSQSDMEYHLHVIDANGCELRDTFYYVIVAPQDATIDPAGPVALCVGDSVTLSAPAGLRSYLWSDGEQTQSIKVLKPGAFFVAVADFNGCASMSDTVLVILTAKPNPIIFGPNSVCPQSTTSYSGGSDTSMLYAWSLSGGGSITAGANANVVSVQWTAVGAWTLTLHQTNKLSGCSRDTSVVVTVDSRLTPAIDPAGPITLCAGDSATLTAPSGYTSYEWSNGATTPSTIVSSSGSYTVTVMGSAGCSGTSLPVVVTVLGTAKPHPVIAASAKSVCEGDFITLSTTASFASYQWSSGETTPTIQVYTSGNYSVLVGNGDGCTGLSDSVTVTVHPSPIVSIAASEPVPVELCPEDSVILTATAGGLKYDWSDGEATRAIVVKNAGNYYVRMTDSNGCVGFSSTVQVTNLPQNSGTLSGLAIVCANSEAAYGVSTVTRIAYLWRATGGTITRGQSTDTAIVLWGNAGTGRIDLTETDTTTGCTTKLGWVVTIKDSLAPLISPPGQHPLCDGDSLTLDAGAGYASYQWMLYNTKLPSDTLQTLVVRAPGDYSVFVSSGSGCEGTSDISTIVVNPIPPAPVITEVGQTLNSTAAASYQWSESGQPIAGATAQSLASPPNGTYTVTIIDQNGCSNISQPFIYKGDSAASLVYMPLVTTANPADPVKLPLLIKLGSSFTQSGAMHFTAQLRFNKTLLAPTGATPAGVIVGNDMIVTLSGTNPLPLGTTSGTLQTLDFLATLGTDTCTDITIDSFEWTDGAVSVTKQSGRFCLSGVCEAGGTVRLIDPDAKLSLSQSKPNPATNRAEVEYDLAEQGETELYITDMLGREVKHVVSGLALPGHYRAQFDLTGLAQGSYIYVLKTPSAKLSHLMEVVR